MKYAIKSCGSAEMMADVLSDSDQTAPAAKRKKVTIDQSAESDFFADLFDSGTTETSSVDELEQYLNSNENASSSLLSFWEGKEKVWPKLNQCAQ